MTRDTSRRRKQINICVTEAEYRRILAAAQGSSLSMSSYVRRKAMQGAYRDAARNTLREAQGEATGVAEPVVQAEAQP